jgi:hypothetical protein
VTRQDIVEAVEEAQRPLVTRVDRLSKERHYLLAITALAFITAIVSVLYGLNREDALQNQLDANQKQGALSRIVVCAAAKSTSLAPRDQPLGGETRDRYLNRLEAQREQLLAVVDLRCPTLPGFSSFPFLRAHAIAEIETILQRLAPDKLRRALEAEAVHKTASVLPTESSSATIPAIADGVEGSGNSAIPASPPGSSPSPKHPSSPQPHGPSPPHESGGDGGEKHPNQPITSPVTPVSEPNPEPSTEPTPSEPEAAAKPGLLDPTLNKVCELASAVGLCTPR